MKKYMKKIVMTMAVCAMSVTAFAAVRHLILHRKNIHIIVRRRKQTESMGRKAWQPCKSGRVAMILFFMLPPAFD